MFINNIFITEIVNKNIDSTLLKSLHDIIQYKGKAVSTDKYLFFSSYQNICVSGTVRIGRAEIKFVEFHCDRIRINSAQCNLYIFICCNCLALHYVYSNM